MKLVHLAEENPQTESEKALKAVNVLDNSFHKKQTPDAEPAPPESNLGHQAVELERFGKKLLHATQDSPQTVIDLVNRHFGELV